MHLRVFQDFNRAAQRGGGGGNWGNLPRPQTLGAPKDYKSIKLPVFTVFVEDVPQKEICPGPPKRSGRPWTSNSNFDSL